jgi:RNA polymerase sigma-70 factor (ECF subfamily)
MRALASAKNCSRPASCASRARRQAASARSRRAGRRAAVSLDQPTGGHGAVDAAALGDLLADEAPGPLDTPRERERQEWVRDSVARLPGPLRQVLILAYYQDLKYAEIAGLLGVPLGTVKSRLFAAIARLRERARAADVCESR